MAATLAPGGNGRGWCLRGDCLGLLGLVGLDNLHDWSVVHGVLVEVLAASCAALRRRDDDLRVSSEFDSPTANLTLLPATATHLRQVLALRAFTSNRLPSVASQTALPPASLLALILNLIALGPALGHWLRVN